MYSKAYNCVMSEKSKYTTLSVKQGVKADLTAFRRDSESYTAALRRLLDERELTDGEIERRLDRLVEKQAQQSRLLVRMAVAQGLSADQIPDDLAADESRGERSFWDPRPAEEDTADVNAEAKREEFEALEEAGKLNHALVTESGEIVTEYGENTGPHGMIEGWPGELSEELPQQHDQETEASEDTETFDPFADDEYPVDGIDPRENDSDDDTTEDN